MRITYFIQDLSDPAVTQRVRMLRAGGSTVELLGFRRSSAAIPHIDDVETIDLGQTFEGRLASRAFLVARRSIGARRWRDLIHGADVVLARNLDMCTIADAARGWAGSRVPMVYECLDIHRSLLGDSLPSRLLRRWERQILRRSTALVVSSPAFVTNNFKRLGGDHLPTIILAENKRVVTNTMAQRSPPSSISAPPWRIGWFGNIRCADSFQILLNLAHRRPKLIDIELRGRPTRKLQNLIDKHLPLPNMRFGGPYQQTDLAAIYDGVHMTWAIDYFERGLNSDWLLPNRLYEGSFSNRPVIALAGTATAAWLASRGSGIIIQGDPNIELDTLVATLTAARYDELQQAVAAIPTVDLVYTAEDCRRFAAQIAGATSTSLLSSRLDQA
jgi:succinoglycan biosynthesis protein ExoL